MHMAEQSAFVGRPEHRPAAELVVTMGCGDACPVLPGKKYLDWSLQDPAGMPVEVVRAIRDEIAGLVAQLPR